MVRYMISNRQKSTKDIYLPQVGMVKTGLTSAHCTFLLCRTFDTKGQQTADARHQIPIIGLCHSQQIMQN